jgi:hypothetical protein
MRAEFVLARTNAAVRHDTLEKSASRRAGTPRDKRTGSVNEIGYAGREYTTGSVGTAHLAKSN